MLKLLHKIAIQPACNTHNFLSALINAPALMNRATPPSRATTKPFADPFAIHNAAGNGGVVLLCEHASNRGPAHYRGMGLRREQQQRPIASHVGAMAGAMTTASVKRGEESCREREG